MINNPKGNKVLNIITICPKYNKTLKLPIAVITQISAAFGEESISAAALIRVNTVLSGVNMVRSTPLK